MMGTFEIFLVLVLLPVIMMFELTPTFGTIPITTLGSVIVIWFTLIGLLEGVGVGSITMFVVFGIFCYYTYTL